MPSQPPELAGADEQPVPLTPHQLARAWLDALYEFGVYATSSPDR